HDRSSECLPSITFAELWLSNGNSALASKTLPGQDSRLRCRYGPRFALQSCNRPVSSDHFLRASDFQVLENTKAPQVGLEPTTLRLTAGCSAIELLRSNGTDGQNHRDFKRLANAEKYCQSAFRHAKSTFPILPVVTHQSARKRWRTRPRNPRAVEIAAPD